jgi:hypothetical protein
MAGVPEGKPPGTLSGPRRGRARSGGHDSAESGPAAGDSTLAWSVAAMAGALHRLAGASAADVPQAVAAATEAVWWVTVVDAAMNRHHPGPYRSALAALDPAARRAVEGSLAGLRFIRGQLGYCADPGDFIQHAPGANPAGQWKWSAVPPPAPQRGSARDVSPYREYRAQLAGRPVGEVLGRAAGFLCRAHAAACRGHRSPASVM